LKAALKNVSLRYCVMTKYSILWSYAAAQALLDLYKEALTLSVKTKTHNS